jgi:hypothetical protein
LFKIILPLKDVPKGATITKLKGAKEYIVHDSIRLFKEDGEKQEITSDGSSRFLVALHGDANISIHEGDTEVVWRCDLDAAKEFFNRFDEEDN